MREHTQQGLAFGGDNQSQTCLCAEAYASGPLVSTSDRPGHGWVASAPRLAVPLTALACFPPLDTANRLALPPLNR